MNWRHSCKRVAELLSQGLDEPLGWFDRLRLRFHLSLCGDCRNVKQQMLGMKALSADLFSSGLVVDDGESPAASRAPGQVRKDP